MDGDRGEVAGLGGQSKTDCPIDLSNTVVVGGVGEPATAPAPSLSSSSSSSSELAHSIVDRIDNSDSIVRLCAYLSYSIRNPDHPAPASCAVGLG